MEEALYLMALSHLGTMTRAEVFAALDAYGSATYIYTHKAEMPDAFRRALAPFDEALRRAEAELRFCEEQGIAVIPFTDPRYPRRLKEISDPPFTIFYKGTGILNAPRMISVVGTRRISEYGKSVCQRFIHDLHSLLPDAVIVSGLAYGVDIHSHRACLEKSLPTVAVLAHGLDRIYPTMHRDTAARMTECGGLLTEYYAGTNPDKGNFVRRNRIVAGLSDATVVVESAEKGGALITARLAFEANRAVFAFPGRISDPCSEGCHKIIRNNIASLITSARDLVDGMMWEARPEQGEAVQGELFPTLKPEQEAVCARLRGSDGKTVDQLKAETGLPLTDINFHLTELEMEGVVRRLAGNRFCLS